MRLKGLELRWTHAPKEEPPLKPPIRFTVVVALLALLAACSNSDTATESSAEPADTDAAVVDEVDSSDDAAESGETDTSATTTDDSTASAGETSTFTAEVWAATGSRSM